MLYIYSKASAETLFSLPQRNVKYASEFYVSNIAILINHKNP